jgi:hypothetical protein
MRLALAMIAAALSSGCLVVSLQPAYDDQSIVFEEALVGQWENTEDRTEAVIDRGEWRSYKIAYSDKSAATSFHGNLTKIGDALFFDLTQMRGVDAGPFLIPVHGVYRVEIGSDRFTASALEYGWFSRQMADKKLERLLITIDGRRNVSIGAPTPELRAWLAHAPDEAFGVPMTFTRKR